MRIAACAALVLLALLSPVLAQAPETVVVIGQKQVPRAMLDRMVTTRIAPTRSAGKIARWAAPICPEVRGLNPQDTAAMTARIRDIASKSGVKVDNRRPCAANIHIFFTTTPQALLDDVAANHSSLLGWYDSPDQAKALAQVTHPVQAWYATQTRDRYGNAQPDDPAYCSGKIAPRLPSRRELGLGNSLENGKRASDMEQPAACTFAAQASNLNNGLSADFATVLLVADGSAAARHSIAALSDYIALFVLSQTKSFDSCDAMPSIANLLAKSCDADWKTEALTDGDMAYLKALYRMQASASLPGQQADLLRGMERELGVR